MGDKVAETDAVGGSDIESELDRDIGIVGAVALGVGTMIAAGIFVLSGLAVSNVGAMAIGSFLIAAIVASFTAFAYAEFAAIYPESGGGYMYVANTFDSDLTYIVGWSMILGYPASAAFYLASFSDWFYRFLYPALSIPKAIPFWVAGLLVLGLLLAVNLKGTEETGLFQIIVTALKVGLIILFLYGGFQAFDASVAATSFAENATNFDSLFLTSALVFITFFGFEAIATNAEEIKEPGRTIPRAIFFSMGFVTVVYALVVLVIVFAINNNGFIESLIEMGRIGAPAGVEGYIEANAEVAMALAAQYYLGGFGFYVIIVGALFSMLSAANATILAGSRVKLAMSRRNHLPQQFEDLHPTLNTPYKSVLLTGGFILLYILFFTVLFGGGPTAEGKVTGPFGLHLGIESIAHFADFMLLGGLIFVNLAIIQSRRKFPDIERAFEVPFVPWVPIIAVLANFALLANVEQSSLILGLVAEVIGVAFWFAWKSRSRPVQEIERETPTVVAERNPSGHERDYQLVVPIANPDHVEQMMSTALDIARDRNGEVLVMSVVDLPEQTPLEEGYQYVDEQREVLRRAMALTDGGGTEAETETEASGLNDLAEEPNTTVQDVPISGTVRIGHHIDDAILNTIEQYEADAVLMGWSGQSSRREAILGSIVDTVVEDADCDVLVERIRSEGGETIDSILLPAAGGPHSEFAAEVAQSIARPSNTRIDVVRVVKPEMTKQDRDDARERLESTTATITDTPAEHHLIEGKSVVDTLVDESKDYDLTIVGATRAGPLQQLIFGTIPEQIGRKSESTVIMVKRYLDIKSKATRLLDQTFE
ncbi:amino acid permease [Halocatena marina]|uniref:amino acid permease n=1 Tax=Halocatena marina TaxID=2934937 RepID=UPI00200E5F5C|nr:amino acid permease [Halocatena marina]